MPGKVQEVAVLLSTYAGTAVDFRSRFQDGSGGQDLSVQRGKA